MSGELLPLRLSVKGYVGILAGYHRSQSKDFMSPAMVLSAHGREYPPVFKRCRRGVAQMCYHNSALLAQNNPGLTYVEGWAATELGLAVEHAWCVDKDGVIHDPTWTGGRTRPKGTEYFGVPIPTKILTLIGLETGNSGVFAQWFAWMRISRILETEMPEIMQPLVLHNTT